MNIKKSYLFLLLTSLSFIFSIACSACSLTRYNINGNEYDMFLNKEQNMLEHAKLSVVKVVANYKVSIKLKSVTTTITASEENDKTATGSIIKHYDNDTSLILTAGHFCEPLEDKEIKFFFPYYNEKKHDVVIDRTFIIFDYDGNAHIGAVVSVNSVYDTCVILTKQINLPALKIAPQLPRPSQHIYSINFPMGLWEKKYAPVFQGFFIGEIFTSHRSTYSFTLPTEHGCSGGAILDSNGNVVGMIHSFIKKFNLMTLAATLPQIKDIIETSDYLYRLKPESFILQIEEKEKSL